MKGDGSVVTDTALGTKVGIWSWQIGLMTLTFKGGMVVLGVTALVALVQDWFVQNSKSGEVPDESTIRKRLTSLWRKLRGEETV